MRYYSKRVTSISWIERVHAPLALKKEVHLNPDEIMQFCKERIAKYKVPKSGESLPKNSRGKVLEKDLRTQHPRNTNRRDWS